MKNYKIDTDELFKGIVQRIKLVRNEKGFSLQDISDKTGFTKSYLSQIENLKREPPISTLAKIAYALDVDPAFLIRFETSNLEIPSFTIVKKGEGKVSDIIYDEKSCFYESIAYNKPDRLMDGYIVTMNPGFVSKSFSHEGQEMVYVLEGTHEFIHDGKTYFFEKGDSYYFDSNRPHFARMLGDRPGKVLVIFAVQKISVASALLGENKIQKGDINK
jgi:transcriptional regulator with XRE-family HTH domain